SLLNFINENGFSSLRAKYQMVVYEIHLIPRMFVLHTVDRIPEINNNFKGRLFIPWVKTQGFLIAFVL
ncbi:MAG: hypothetical protein ACM3SR_07950, partial [Ignavibacteriales bacterium]